MKSLFPFHRLLPASLVGPSLLAILILFLAITACSSPNGEASSNDTEADAGQDVSTPQDTADVQDTDPGDAQQADVDDSLDSGADADTGDTTDAGDTADVGDTTDTGPINDADDPEPEDRLLEDTNRIFAGYFTIFDDDLMIAGHPHVYNELVDDGHDPSIAEDGLLVDVSRIDAESVGEFAYEGDAIAALDEAVEITATELHDDEAVVAAHDTAFYTVLTVPEDFDTDHLAPAIFVYDYDGDSWWDFEFAQGFYDPSENLYFIETTFIGGSDFPARVVLAEHDWRTTEVWDGVFQDLIEIYFPTLEEE